MKKIILLIIPALFFLTSCTKENTTIAEKTMDPAPPPVVQETVPTKHIHKDIYNPILGTWVLGAYKILCYPGADTIIYPNERGDYIEFRNNDSAYYTYITTQTKGLSNYEILDSLTFVLGDTMHIISYDGTRLTTTFFGGASQRWMTYIKQKSR